MTVGIESVGAYAPAYRLSAEALTEAWGQFHGAGISETAVPAGDEDVVTMAYEAGSRALAASDVASGDVDALVLGTTTPPYEEEAVGPRLASMLRLDEATETRQLTGSTAAGVEAVAAGADRAEGIEGAVLVVAGDAPRGAPDEDIEHAGGAGAAALVLVPDGPGGILDRAEYTRAVPGTRFRPAGSAETTGLGITEYDRAAFVDAVTEAATGLEHDPGSADAVALQAPNGKLPYRASGPLGVETDAIRRGTTVHDIGDTGAASPLLGLADALDAGHTDVVVVGYGSGGTAVAMRLDAAGVALDADLAGEEGCSYGEYLRMRGDVTPGEPDGGGGYVSVPSWTRTIPQRHRLVAGRCPACGELAFPPVGACTGCGRLPEYEDVRLPGTGTVEAATVIGQGGAPPEFVEQQARSGAYVSAIVALDGPDGDSVSIPAQVVGAGVDSVDIGDRVEATVRRIYTQEGVTRYGFKMRPVDG